MRRRSREPPERRHGPFNKMFGSLAAVAALVVLGGVIAFVVLRRESGSAIQDTAADTLAADTVVPVQRTFHGDTLRRNELFSQLLTRLRIDEHRVAAAQAALESTDFDFRHMHPGDSVTLVYVDSVPVSLSYHLDMATRYEVVFTQDSARADLVTAPVETVAAVLSGVVDGSLWKSMIESGASPQLVESFTEVLRNAVDFRRGVNKGDTFGLLVEKHFVDGAFYRFGDIIAVRYRDAGQETEAFLYRSPDGRGFFCDATGRSLDRLLEYPPVLGGRRTSDFGTRFHPIRRRRIKHSGLDYAAPYQTEVRSVSQGTVTMRRWQGGYGRSVVVSHENGTTTRYSHLSRYGPGIRNGVQVGKGQVVGFVGSTGLSTGFHLDFEVRRNGVAVDPIEELPSGYRQVASDRMPEFLKLVSAARERMRAEGFPGAGSATRMPGAE